MIKSTNKNRLKLCENMYESIFKNKRLFDKLFLKSGLSYKDIKGKTIEEITKLFQKTFNNHQSKIQIEKLEERDEKRILSEIDILDKQTGGGKQIEKNGMSSTIDEDLLLGNISSCHIETGEITEEEKEKMLLYMNFIKNQIETVIPDSSSIKMSIMISGEPHYIVFSHKEIRINKSIIALYRDEELKDELLHISFFRNSFIHLTFINNESDDEGKIIKKAYRLYYIGNPDYQKGLMDILQILKEIQSQIFKRRANIKDSFWCNNQSNNWTTLLDTSNRTKNHLRDDIKETFGANLMKLYLVIWKLDYQEIITPPIIEEETPVARRGT
jgi:hypothetical protein